MKKLLIKIGAYFILISGIIITALILVFALALLIHFPQATLFKRIMVEAGLVFAAVLAFALAFSIFESMHDLLIVEDEIQQIIHKKNDE